MLTQNLKLRWQSFKRYDCRMLTQNKISISGGLPGIRRSQSLAVLSTDPVTNIFLSEGFKLSAATSPLWPAMSTSFLPVSTWICITFMSPEPGENNSHRLEPSRSRLVPPLICLIQVLLENTKDTEFGYWSVFKYINCFHFKQCKLDRQNFSVIDSSQVHKGGNHYLNVINLINYWNIAKVIMQGKLF